jgi:hypothetical protein
VGAQAQINPIATSRTDQISNPAKIQVTSDRPSVRRIEVILKMEKRMTKTPRLRTPIKTHFCRKGIWSVKTTGITIRISQPSVTVCKTVEAMRKGVGVKHTTPGLKKD